MALLDMFDKLDDIVYEPVKAVVNYVNEPLNALHAKRDRKTMQQQADLIAAEKQQEIDLRMQEERHAAELRIDERRWNAEIDEIVAQQEAERCDKLVESIRRYQIDLATASKDIVNSIGIMSMELRERANTMVLEKTQSYKQLQDDAIESAEKRLSEIAERFSNNERIRIKMEDSVIEQMNAIVNSANRFITELADDFKRLNSNTDDLMRMSMKNVDTYLKPMANALSIKTGMGNNLIDTQQITDDNTKEIEAEPIVY